MPKRAIFSMEVIKPSKLFSSNRLRAYVLNALKDESKEIKRILNQTTENWLEKPEFDDTIRYGKAMTSLGTETSGNDPRIYVYPKGNTKGAQKWSRVNNGTNYVPYTFLPTYQAMTEYPGKFGTNRPRTQLMPYKIYNKKSHKRIHARNWTGILQEQRYPIFVQKIEDAIKKGLEPK